MSLIQLKNHLEANRWANLKHLTQLFNVEPDILRDMLSHLVRKGWVTGGPKTRRCGEACQRCSPLLTEIYQWRGQSSHF